MSADALDRIPPLVFPQVGVLLAEPGKSTEFKQLSDVDRALSSLLGQDAIYHPLRPSRHDIPTGIELQIRTHLGDRFKDSQLAQILGITGSLRAHRDFRLFGTSPRDISGSVAAVSTHHLEFFVLHPKVGVQAWDVNFNTWKSKRGHKHVYMASHLLRTH